MSRPFARPDRARSAADIDVLAVGELLVDLISTDVCEDLGQAQHFRRLQGGSAANLVATLARLGRRVALVACVGSDPLGDYLTRALCRAGVPDEGIATDSERPTSAVWITRTAGTADFLVYRGADRMILPTNIRDDDLRRSTLFHTTCFALSRTPARDSILEAAERAVSHGCRLSLDANYAPAVWPDREQALATMARYCSHGGLVKASRDDLARIFDEEAPSESEAASRVHGWGAAWVCVTLGEEGSFISWDRGARQQRVAAPSTTVADATGAGDAFWAGFLSAWLDGYEPTDCSVAGHNMARIKLATVGPIEDKVDRSLIYVYPGR